MKEERERFRRLSTSRRRFVTDNEWKPRRAYCARYNSLHFSPSTTGTRVAGREDRVAMLREGSRAYVTIVRWASPCCSGDRKNGWIWFDGISRPANPCVAGCEVHSLGTRAKTKSNRFAGCALFKKKERNTDREITARPFGSRSFDPRWKNKTAFSSTCYYCGASFRWKYPVESGKTNQRKSTRNYCYLPVTAVKSTSTESVLQKKRGIFFRQADNPRRTPASNYHRSTTLFRSVDCRVEIFNYLNPFLATKSQRVSLAGRGEFFSTCRDSFQMFSQRGWKRKERKVGSTEQLSAVSSTWPKYRRDFCQSFKSSHFRKFLSFRTTRE